MSNSNWFAVLLYRANTTKLIDWLDDIWDCDWRDATDVLACERAIEAEIALRRVWSE